MKVSPKLAVGALTVLAVGLVWVRRASASAPTPMMSATAATALLTQDLPTAKLFGDDGNKVIIMADPPEISAVEPVLPRP